MGLQRVGQDWVTWTLTFPLAAGCLQCLEYILYKLATSRQTELCFIAGSGTIIILSPSVSVSYAVQFRCSIGSDSLQPHGLCNFSFFLFFFFKPSALYGAFLLDCWCKPCFKVPLRHLCLAYALPFIWDDKVNKSLSSSFWLFIHWILN